MSRLLGQHLQAESGDLVGDPLTLQRPPLHLDRLHAASDLGDLTSRLIDILIGDFDVHAEQSAKAQPDNSTQIGCAGEP